MRAAIHCLCTEQAYPWVQCSMHFFLLSASNMGTSHQSSYSHFSSEKVLNTTAKWSHVPHKFPLTQGTLLIQPTSCTATREVLLFVLLIAFPEWACCLCKIRIPWKVSHSQSQVAHSVAAKKLILTTISWPFCFIEYNDPVTMILLFLDTMVCNNWFILTPNDGTKISPRW